MISKKQFQEFSEKEKYNFLIKILTQIEDKNIMWDLRQLFKVVKDPSEKMLLTVFEIIESILDYTNDKENSQKQEHLTLIKNKLKDLKNKEHLERQDIKWELEELLGKLD